QRVVKLIAPGRLTQDAVAPHERHVNVTVALTLDAPSVAVTTTESGPKPIGASSRPHLMLKPPELVLAGIVTCVAEREIHRLPSVGEKTFVSCTVTPSAGAAPLSVIVPSAVPPPTRV